MWLGYGANQFLVTRLVALTQKVKARGSAPGRGGEGEAEARDPQEAAPLLRRPIYIFNIYCFLLIEQEEEVVGRSLITPPPLSASALRLFLSS